MARLSSYTVQDLEALFRNLSLKDDEETPNAQTHPSLPQSTHTRRQPTTLNTLANELLVFIAEFMSCSSSRHKGGPKDVLHRAQCCRRFYPSLRHKPPMYLVSGLGRIVTLVS